MADRNGLSNPGGVALLTTFVVLLWRGGPFAWQWWLRNFWHDPDLRSSWSLLDGRPLILFWAVVAVAVTLAVALLASMLVSTAVDRGWKLIRRPR